MIWYTYNTCLFMINCEYKLINNVQLQVIGKLRPKNEREQAYYGDDDIPIPSPIHQRANDTEHEYAYFNTTDYGQPLHSSYDHSQYSHCSHNISFSHLNNNTFIC